MLRSIENEKWFILGSFPDLSAAEISAVLELNGNGGIYKPPFFIVSGRNFDECEIMKRLGGTVKIATGLFSTDDEESLITKIYENLNTIPGKVIFGISNYCAGGNAKFSEIIGKEVKKRLKQSGISARYVFNGEAILSTVTVEKNGLDRRGREFLISQEGSNFFVAKTTVIQPFKEWGDRDFGRPERDDLSGMLPPKLARIMLNLSFIKKRDTILDPFCGSGTIITEAMIMGVDKIIGADKSRKAIADTQSNIDWLISKNVGLENIQIDLHESDVSSLPKIIGSELVDNIITEPFLGKPLHGKENTTELRRQASELSVLYRMAFISFSKILKKGGRVIIVFPRFRDRGEWITVNIKENLKTLGFTPEALLKTENRINDSLLYVRPNQKVGREIWRFKKN